MKGSQRERSGEKILHPNQVIHGHVCLGEHGRKAIKEKSQFLIHIRRSHAPSGVETDASRKIQVSPVSTASLNGNAA